MIPISNDLKNAVIYEEMPKQLEVTITQTDNLKVLNWYATEYHGSNWYNLDIGPGNSVRLLNLFKFDVDGAINYDYVDQAEQIGVSFDLQITDIDVSTSSTEAQVRLDFVRSGSAEWASFSNINAGVYPEPERFGYVVSATGFEKFTAFRIYNPSTTKNLKAKFSFSNVKIYMYTGEPGSVVAYSGIFATPINVARYIALGTFGNTNILSQSFSFTESICSQDRLKFGLAESSIIELSLLNARKIPAGCDVDISLHIGDAEDGFEWKNFVIEKSKKRSSGGIGVCDLTCYDRLAKLDQNAYSWYTKYMWGMNLDSPQPNEQYKFDYCRQIYGTLRSALLAFGVEKGMIYAPNSYVVDTYNPLNYATQDRYFNFTTESYVAYKRILFSKKSYTRDSDYNAVHVYASYTFIYAYWNLMDKFRRGVYNNASIYIDFNCPNETIRILADSGELVAIPPDCETFDVYVPYAFGNNNFIIEPDGQYISSVSVYQYKNNPYYDMTKIKNGCRQLPYFSYKTGKPTVNDIIKVDSDITVRDIVRSICEMCGCFFRLDRSGNPTFIYASEHGLYPSNTLFPSDNLFPKKSSEITMPTTYYIKAEFAEYQVSNYGGVQVIVNSRGSSGGVCRIEYWSDPDSDNAYIIDDNIFLCANEFTLDDTTDLMIILENMYECLDNLQYTPFEVDAIGTPFLESGDRFTLLTQNDGFESFIFERRLKGIQALRDSFEARGIQKTPRIKNFEWEA